MSDRSYFHDAEDWYDQRYADLERRSRWYLILAVCSLGLGIAGLSTTMVLLPLKEFVPVIFEVDRATGLFQEVRNLSGKAMDPTEAITRYFVNKYVLLRETYDPHDIEENAQLVGRYSEKSLYEDYKRGVDKDNPESPTVRFGTKTSRSVRVVSFSVLSDDTMHVRFETETKIRGEPSQKHFWVAVVGFRFIDAELSSESRLANPLGFQVTRYRVDREIF